MQNKFLKILYIKVLLNIYYKKNVKNNRKSNKIKHCVDLFFVCGSFEDMGIFHVFIYLSVMDRYKVPYLQKLTNKKITTVHKSLLFLLFSQMKPPSKLEFKTPHQTKVK